MTALTKKHRFDEVYDAQKVYRLLLTAVSNPAKSVNIREYAEKLYGAHPAMLALAFTLLDNEVGFSVLEDEALAGDIACLTLSREAEPEEADYLFVTDPSLLEDAVRRAKCGTLRDPHRSATLIVECAGRAGLFLRLAGPGIGEASEFSVTETVKTALEFRDKQCYEAPCGIDFVFVSEDGGLLALPRLVRREAR